MATSLEAVQNCKEMFNQIGRYGGIVGVNMVQPNYRASLLTMLMLSLNILLVSSNFYTIIFLDSKSGWLSANVMGIALQVIIRHPCIFKKKNCNSFIIIIEYKGSHQVLRPYD